MCDLFSSKKNTAGRVCENHLFYNPVHGVTRVGQEANMVMGCGQLPNVLPMRGNQYAQSSILLAF